jgi:hypothetical protein
VVIDHVKLWGLFMGWMFQKWDKTFSWDWKFWHISNMIFAIHSLRSTRPAMGNLRPFKLFSVTLLKPFKYAFFIEKSTKSVEKACTLALDITV